MLETLMTTDARTQRAYGGGGSRRRFEFETGDFASLKRIRAALARDAKSRTVEAADAELVIGELIGNVVRYAPGPGYVEIEWHRDSVTIEVVDAGSGFTYEPALPADPFAETGRGLFLVRAYSRAFSVDALPGGGSRARANVATPASH